MQINGAEFYLASLTRGLFIPRARNELRFSFQDVVVLRTAFQPQSVKVSSRKILKALAKLKAELQTNFAVWNSNHIGR